MGKGNQSRDGRDDSILTKTQKQKKQKKGHAPLPKWLVPTLVSVVAVIIVFAIVFAALVNNGVFKRNNVLVKSQQQSKYNVNQMAAQIMLWYSGWVQGQNAYYGTLTSSSEYNQNTEFSWCWAYASSMQSDLKESIGESSAWFEELTALCDWGRKNGVAFTAEDEETAYDAFVSSFRSQAKSYYKYAKEVGFSNDNGENEKFPVDYSSYVDYPSYPYFSGFLRNIFGTGIKSSDFRRAATILTYASRVKTLKQSEYWNGDAATIADEIKENPDKYYSVDYLRYTAEDQALAFDLIAVEGGEDGVNAFKKIIVTDYIEKNYFGEYNELLANELLKKLEGKVGKDLAAKLEEQELTVVAFEAPVEPAGDESAEEGESAGDEGDDEPAEDNGLTEKQSAWLFDKTRKADDMTVIAEEDDSSTLLVITELTKDDGGNVTAVKAVVKNFAEVLNQADYEKLINEVCHHLGLPHDHAAEEEEEPAGETEGDAEPAEGGEEGEQEEAGTTLWDDLVEAMESGASGKLPSKSSALYVKATDIDKDLEEVKTELDAKETAEDKATYLKDKNASEYTGVTADNENIDDAIKAIVFPEEGTAEVGLTQIVETNDGDTKHLIYVTEVKTEGEGDEAKTLVTFYDYSVSKYPTRYQQFLFEEVDEETMTGGPGVGRTFYDKVSDTQHVVYIVTRAISLGDQVVRGGYASFTNEDEARAAKEALKGLTGIELLNKLAELKSDAVTSNKITESSISSAVLKDWLFSEDRAENDYDVVMLKDENNNITGLYVAVFLNRTSAGESDARTNIATEKANDFAGKLVEDGGYKLNEKALAKIGTWLYK